MESWSIARVNRFKNLLAFLLVSFEHVGSFSNYLYSISPDTLEATYLRYLGENLPTDCEYAIGLSEKVVKMMDVYCESWVSIEV